MKSFPKTRFVFDRKKTATNKIKGLIQVEILCDKRKKYISTGVKVYKNQWDVRIGVCNSFEMVELNKRITAIKSQIDQYVTTMIEEDMFSFERLEVLMRKEKECNVNFIEYIDKRINERKDIRDSSKRSQRKLVGSLKEFGQIDTFKDLTRANILAYDDFLRSKGLKQTTIWSYHKCLKTYIHDAMSRELLSTDPYLQVKIKRGESEQGRWLSENEFERIRDVKLPSETLCKVRDMFVVQCLTGLSYSDLSNFDFNDILEDKGVYYITGERVKTGIAYCTVLLPDVMAIVKSYGGKLPTMSNQQYNMRLKIVADYAGIDKDIASHWGRRTCGMLLLNKGVSIEVVARVLGHKSIRTTESVYAKLLDKSVIRAVSNSLSDE